MGEGEPIASTIRAIELALSKLSEVDNIHWTDLKIITNRVTDSQPIGVWVYEEEELYHMPPTAIVNFWKIQPRYHPVYLMRGFH